MILIIDNYDSFTYNLVHLVAGHTKNYKVIRNDEFTVDQVISLRPEKILISPGPGRPENAGITEDIIREMGEHASILGVCLGHQAIGEVYGCKVVHAPTLMHGKTSKILHDGKSIYSNVPQGFIATRYHSLVLDPESIPEELVVTSRTEDGVVMGVRHKNTRWKEFNFIPKASLQKKDRN